MPTLAATGQITITDVMDGLHARLSNESYLVPTEADGSAGVYTGCATTMSVYLGTSDNTANWSFSATPSSGVTGTLVSNVYTVSNMTVDAGYVDITGTRAGFPSVTARFSVAKAKKGSAGTVGADAVIYDLSCDSVVITKASPDAATAGAHSTVTIRGKKTTGPTTTNYGWITVTPNGGVEATTATDTASAAYVLAPANGDGKTSYTVKLYNQATVAGATLLDTQVISVVFKGATGTNGIDSVAYWIVNSNATVARSAGVYLPTAITFSIKAAQGASAPAAYAGRFIIATSVDGSTWGDSYTSSVNESTYTFTIPATTKFVRCRAYLAGGTVTLLDESISTVIDNAASFTAIAAGNAIMTSSNSFTKKVGTGNGWDSSVYSKEAYMGGVFCSASPTTANSDVMLGLNQDPTANASYDTLDYALYCKGTGYIDVWENGTQKAVDIATYTPSTVLSIAYDGAVVRYMVDGVVKYTTQRPTGPALFLDTSVYQPGVGLNNLIFASTGSTGATNSTVTFVTTSSPTIVVAQTLPNRFEKTIGGTAWNAQAYSNECFSGACQVSGRTLNASYGMMFGLNSDPTLDASYTSIDYAWYCEGGTGSLIIYENGTGLGSFGTYTTSTQLTITYDGLYIRYLKDGVEMRKIERISSAPLYFDSSYMSNGSGLKDLSFGPMGGVTTSSYINYATAELWDVATSTNALGRWGGDFVLNGDGNVRSWGTDPYGRPAITWKSINNDVASDADGGWNKTITGLSASKSYMSVVYFRRTSSSANGTWYHGCGASTTLNIDGTSGYSATLGTDSSNPYFYAVGVSSFDQNEWYVSVGFIHANGSPVVANTGSSGVWRLSDGVKVFNSNEFKMGAGATAQTHRTYLYYSTDPTTSMEWWGPGFYEINGNEPSLYQILNKPGIAITGVLSNESHVVPTDSAGNNGNYTGAATTLTIYKGLTDDSANWTYSVVKTNVTCAEATNSRVQTVTALSADVGYVDITATRTGYASITKRFTLTKGKTGATGANGTNGTNGTNGAAGTRGSKTFYVSGQTSWTDAAANTATAAVGGSVLNDVVTEYGTNFSATKFWDGSVWQTITAAIDGNLIVAGTIGAAKIAANSIDATKLNVTSLSAITANIGTLRTATTGGRLEISDNVIKVYDESNNLRVKIGNLSL